MINFSLVDIDNIKSDVPRSEFSESDLENLASIILESGGIVRPLILKETEAETYTVIDGYLEYYAAVKAREKNPRKGEMVNAFVISPKIEDLVLKQTAILKEVESLNQAVRPLPETTKLEPRLANIELRFEQQLNQFKSELLQEKQRVDDKFKEFANLIPKKIQPLEVFNNLNVSELVSRLINAGFASKTATRIAESIEKERKKKKFTSLSDVVMRVKITSGKKFVKAITSEKMIEIVDNWSLLLFR
ncbi:chromosome partitioning protein ParB [Chlorogloeopsis sp. ULAP02]|uniref:ParB N-terminal domain-containing protein n=1 Tax=Chlorogloeopsis sp. ULAP02 TaxID=3107926 RepID=UPI0031354B31